MKNTLLLVALIGYATAIKAQTGVADSTAQQEAPKKKHAFFWREKRWVDLYVSGGGGTQIKKEPGLVGTPDARRSSPLFVAGMGIFFNPEGHSSAGFEYNNMLHLAPTLRDGSDKGNAMRVFAFFYAYHIYSSRAEWLLKVKVGHVDYERGRSYTNPTYGKIDGNAFYSGIGLTYRYMISGRVYASADFLLSRLKSGAGPGTSQWNGLTPGTSASNPNLNASGMLGVGLAL